MKWNSRTRCTIVCALFAILFSVFSYRLIYLQMVQHEYYSKIAAEKNVGRNVIRAERGAIYDTHDEVLAQNVAALNHNGTFPDAIELFNEGTATVDLTDPYFTVVQLMLPVVPPQHHRVIARRRQQTQRQCSRRILPAWC